MVRSIGEGGAAQVALNGTGWRELVKTCRIVLDVGILKLYKP